MVVTPSQVLQTLSVAWLAIVATSTMATFVRSPQTCSQPCTEGGLVSPGGTKYLHTETVQQLRNCKVCRKFLAMIFSYQQDLLQKLLCNALAQLSASTQTTLAFLWSLPWPGQCALQV